MQAAFQQAVGDMADDADDFAEAFDWKARMRPELDEPAPVRMAEAKPVEQRLSGWALPPQAAAIAATATKERLGRKAKNRIQLASPSQSHTGLQHQLNCHALVPAEWFTANQSALTTDETRRRAL